MDTETLVEMWAAADADDDPQLWQILQRLLMASANAALYFPNAFDAMLWAGTAPEPLAKYFFDLSQLAFVRGEMTFINKENFVDNFALPVDNYRSSAR